MTRGELLSELTVTLGARHEARFIVEEVLGARRRPIGQAVDPAEVDRRPRLAARRRAGEPLQYVLGHWAFRSLDLLVDSRVLIPRPETEQVVEVALRELRRPGTAGSGHRRCRHRVGRHRPGLGHRAGAIEYGGAPVGDRHQRRRPGRGPGKPRSGPSAAKWPRSSRHLRPGAVAQPAPARRHEGQSTWSSPTRPMWPAKSGPSSPPRCAASQAGAGGRRRHRRHARDWPTWRRCCARPGRGWPAPGSW